MGKGEVNDMLVETPPVVGSVGDASACASPRFRGLADLAALRLALTGESPVDTSRVFFGDWQAVDDFLRLHQFDTDNPLDLGRLAKLHQEATIYLTEIHRYHLPRQVERIDTIHDLFLAAALGEGRLQRMACMTLKVMHIIHHLKCREAVFETAISEADLLARLNSKVFRIIDAMRAAGVAVDEFATGKKSRTSQISKLLAKRGTLATHIFDKLRFRIVLHSREDLVLGLIYLMQHLVPFNYVVPDQSQNGLITVDDVVRILDLAPETIAQHWRGASLGSAPPSTPRNEFSGSSYRCVNFVADIPIRIDDVSDIQPPAIAVVQAEIQLMDAAAALANEQGENAHDLYKKRQRANVRRRLEGGSE